MNIMYAAHPLHYIIYLSNILVMLPTKALRVIQRWTSSSFSGVFVDSLKKWQTGRYQFGAQQPVGVAWRQAQLRPSGHAWCGRSHYGRCHRYRGDVPTILGTRPLCWASFLELFGPFKNVAKVNKSMTLCKAWLPFFFLKFMLAPFGMPYSLPLGKNKRLTVLEHPVALIYCPVAVWLLLRLLSNQRFALLTEIHTTFSKSNLTMCKWIFMIISFHFHKKQPSFVIRFTKNRDLQTASQPPQNKGSL